ncbi:hypothetical protein EYZ11_012261 [Aspergillus tanneri]|uniref:Uncharacterized protein n=1 Tax=Aspergillus tanneri TaxID=1220188 RepID=A0A4S3J0N8_9EURO|nr:uncharacterized protein ATNIH1004_003093 [Aspergillus tanneri]KAA8650407.1 hypothetical protein ATNIH1004_003093 [Aspergillus tanneri]THC88289.1 hypothetical protein EYZ11_012261 [Aspergillus tanneri]
MEVDCVPSEPNRTACVTSSYNAGVTVYGWPSKGGLYALYDCLGVELEFLGFDRFNPPKLRAGSQAKEDAHCDRMRQLGATWWKSEIGTDLFRREIEGPKLTDEYLRVGWPAGGGVWVLHTTIEVAAEKGAGLTHNAYNMEERCKVIKQMGGVFYADPKDCPYLDLP